MSKHHCCFIGYTICSLCFLVELVFLFSHNIKFMYDREFIAAHISICMLQSSCIAYLFYKIKRLKKTTLIGQSLPPLIPYSSYANSQ